MVCDYYYREVSALPNYNMLDFVLTRLVKLSGVNYDFVDFLLQSPASIEQIFSNFGQIYSKVRKKLGNNTSAKLVFCYYLLRRDVEIDY